MLTVKAQIEWLTRRVESPPTSYHTDLPELAGLRARMAWQKLKRQANEGDEIWAFTTPAGNWKSGKQAGYALVRDGAILESVMVVPG